MSIDKDTVKHISKLARISLDEKKIDNLSKDLLCLNQIVNYPSRINCALLPWQTAHDLIRNHIDE